LRYASHLQPRHPRTPLTATSPQIRLAKKTAGRWVRLVRDPSAEGVPSLDSLKPPTGSDQVSSAANPILTGAAPGSNTAAARRPQHKNWEKLSDEVLKSEKDRSISDDPNAVDSNRAFAELFQHLDEDAKRAMMKSYTESGGTTLSTDWEDVKKAPVTVKPPEGQEWKQWG